MITKQQSKMLQGVAILLMLYHHFFLNPDISVFNFINSDVTRTAAWFAKICVGMFSFVSGYGMCIAMSKCKGFVQKYKNAGIRFLSLILKYWFVIVLFVCINTVFYKESMPFDVIIKNAFLLDFSINGSWWFVRQYFFFLLGAPILDLLFSNVLKNGKERYLALGCIILIGGLFVVSKICMPWMENIYDVIQPTFIMVFVSGYIFKFFDLYKKIELKKMKVLAGAIALVLVATIRVIVANDPSYAKLDFILVPVFAWGLIYTFGQIKWCEHTLAFIGRYATFMWLTHLLVYEKTFELITAINSNPIIFYLLEVVITFLVSFCLNTIYVEICKKVVRQKND